MTIDIDSMSADVTVRSATEGSAPAPSSGPRFTAADLAALKELIRPLVVEVLSEEMGAYLRQRG